MPNNPFILPRGVASADGTVASGAQTSIDDSALDLVTAANAQELAAALNALEARVAAVQPGTDPRVGFGGVFTPFTSSVNVGPSNFDQFVGLTALYARQDNARVNFILPTDPEITAQGVATDARVEVAVLNQAGTGRFDTGFEPTNTVIIDVEGANNIRRNTATGTLLNFIEAHQGDLVTLIQSARGQPWVATRVTLSQAALLLPGGLFRLRNERISANPVLTGLAGFTAGINPTAGDAYEISVGNDNFGGFGVAPGDVIVALRDNPSLLNSADNNDWLVIRNSTNDIISLAEIRFLNQITEVDTFEDDRLVDRGDVSQVRVFLSTGILDHAPFINPSTDPDNPQDDGTQYVGGMEDRGTGNLFELTDFTKVGEPAGSSRFPNAFVYFDIDGTFDETNLLDQVFLVIKDRDGVEVDRHQATDHFRPVTLTGSTDTYYVLDRVGASDNYSTITYLSGYTIDVVFRRTIRGFTVSDAVNVLASIPSGGLEMEKLSDEVRALLTADHSLTDAQQAALSGLRTDGTPTPWTAGDLYVKDNNADPNSDASRYVNVDQLNGILADHGHTRSVTFVVPNFVTVNGLIRESDDQTLSVTRVGAITLQDNTVNPPRTFNGQGFRATLPSSSFDINNPVGDIWRVDGTASNLELSGADDSFKVRRANLADALTSWIQSLVPAAPTPVSLPDNLQQFLRHMTVVVDTSSGWSDVNPSPLRADLSRQFAALWDEDRRSFGTGNYFADLTGVELIGFQANNIFFYPDPNDEYNTSFPGAQSYILNAPVRIRNASGQTTISDGFEKIIGFDYALNRQLSSGEDDPILRPGSSSATPMIGLSEQEGLYLNIGRGDGGQHSRTYDAALQVDGGQWHSGVDEVVAAEAEVIIPDDFTGSLTLRIDIQQDNNGNDEGTHSQTVTITNLDADQDLGAFGFNYANNQNIIVHFTYDHDNTDLPRQRRVLFLRPTQAFGNAALTYNVRANHRVTETWTSPSTYARYPINAGDGHDDFGIFDPHLYNTEHVRERNRVLLSVQKYRPGDTSADPELAVVVIVDGEAENSGNPIRLHRAASEFAFDDIRFGNNNCAVSHIQCYDWSGPAPSIAELQRMYAHANNWLGAFWPPGHAVDNIVIDANIELTSGHGLILTDGTSGTRKLVEVDNGDWVFKDA